MYKQIKSSKAYKLVKKLYKRLVNKTKILIKKLKHNRIIFIEVPHNSNNNSKGVEKILMTIPGLDKKNVIIMETNTKHVRVRSKWL